MLVSNHFISMEGGPDRDQPHEAFAADAGYVVGLCAHYEDFDKGPTEERQMPVRQVLTILYTQSALVLYKAPRTQTLQFYDLSVRGDTLLSEFR